MSFEIQINPPRPEIQALAEKELRENEENVRNGLESLKKLLEGTAAETDVIFAGNKREEPNLYYSTDDEFLMIFLRPCKFYPKSALDLMRRVAEFKQKNAALLHNLLPSDEKEVLLNSNIVNVMAHRDHKNRRVMLVHCGKVWDPSKATADQMFRIFYIVHQMAANEPETQICGVVVIMDFDGLAMKQVMGLTPSFSMRLLTFIQDAMPLRLKEVHIVKQPFLFNMVWQMFKPFVKEKLKKRLFFHGTKMSSLHTHIPPSHLPKNYGGEMKELDYGSKDWYPALSSYEPKIKEWNTYGIRQK